MIETAAASVLAPSRPREGRVRVCMVAGNFPPQIGGPATQAFHLSKVLQEHGIDPVIVTFGERSGEEQYEGLRVFRQRLQPVGGSMGKVLRLVGLARLLGRVIRKERPTVIHCHDSHMHSLVACTVARIMGVPTVLKFAGDMVWEKVNARGVRTRSIREAHRLSVSTLVLAWLQRTVLRRVDIVWAASQFRRRDLVEALGIDAANIRVIPNYIRLDRALAGTRETASDGTRVVLSAGRFAAHKRLDRTMEILSRLDPATRLVLIGEGDDLEEAAVERELDRWGVRTRVQRLGKVTYTELLGWMQRADVLLSTSEEEGFGIVFVEAMACGLPVVALRIGAIPEVVVDGETGFLVDPDSIEAARDAVARLLSDAALHSRMSLRGPEHALRYDLASNWQVYADLYHELLGAKERSVT